MILPNNKTKKYISISSSPGNTGSYFHNTLFKKFHLNNIYIPYKITSLDSVKKFLLNFQISGCSVSMPFKERVTKFLDQKDKSVKITNNANTILIHKNKLIGFNTDFIAAKIILKKLNIKKDVLLLGDGAVARTIYVALKDLKFNKIHLCSRKKRYKNWKLNKNTTVLNWNNREEYISNLLINATSIGMKDKDSFPISENNIKFCKIIFDLVINEKTKLKKFADKYKISYISGKEFSFFQAYEQFKIYTNINVNRIKIKKILKYNF